MSTHTKKLRQAIQGIQHSKDDAQMEALKRIQQTLQPESNTTNGVKAPRVEAELTESVPRVRFNEAAQKVHEPPLRLVVAWPQKQIVQSQVPKEKPKPILKSPKFVESSDTIASRVRARRREAPQAEPPQFESIADRVARRRREKETVHSYLTKRPANCWSIAPYSSIRGSKKYGTDRQAMNLEG